MRGAAGAPGELWGMLDPGGGSMAEEHMEGGLKEGPQASRTVQPCAQRGPFQAQATAGSESPGPTSRAESLLLRRSQLPNLNRSASRSSRRSGKWVAGTDSARLSVGSTRRKGLKDILRQNSQASASWLMAPQREDLPDGGQDQGHLTDANLDDLSLALDPLEHEWMLTVAQGNVEGILHLLSKDPSLLSKRDFVTGFTVLHWLAKHGHHENLIQVITFAEKNCYPVDVDVRTASGRLTPLHLAALQGHEMVIKVLVGAYGANTSLRDHNGLKAWQYLRSDAPRELKELSGACEEDLDTIGAQNNRNNNNNSRPSRWGAFSTFKVESRERRPSQRAGTSSLSYLRSKLRRAFAYFQQL
ncbi:ankyrin repeat domain-containing protein SOWAHD [Varanus komodoensis]|uniref:ankyrin repeat domain-containing protein SOWAHD n=1 Tax=Varanus komodoensis TaxID=61221 RepID=UPI001CF7B9F9|nr:ankyrin repeat domain-containing protein SOWAHD [Varanus komodoensis]